MTTYMTNSEILHKFYISQFPYHFIYTNTLTFKTVLIAIIFKVVRDVTQKLWFYRPLICYNRNLTPLKCLNYTQHKQK